MEKLRLGFAMCGSFCTFSKIIDEMENLSRKYDIIPIMSQASRTLDTRFGIADDFVKKIEKITEKRIITEITQAEPIGPKNMIDVMIVAPCTGNTLAKLACGITDDAVTMAVKSHLRNSRPVIIAVSTNDALGASAANIGVLLNRKNIYFVPMGQDSPHTKPTSLVADFKLIDKTVQAAISGLQVQPVLITEYS